MFQISINDDEVSTFGLPANHGARFKSWFTGKGRENTRLIGASGTRWILMLMRERSREDNTSTHANSRGICIHFASCILYSVKWINTITEDRRGDFTCGEIVITARCFYWAFSSRKRERKIEKKDDNIDDFSYTNILYRTWFGYNKICGENRASLEYTCMTRDKFEETDVVQSLVQSRVITCPKSLLADFLSKREIRVFVLRSVWLSDIIILYISFTI